MIDRIRWCLCCTLALLLQFALPPHTAIAKEAGSLQLADGLIAPEEQSLAALIGFSEISVLENVDGQFVNSLATNQTLPDEFVSQLAETDILTSVRYGRSFSRESLAALSRNEQATAQTGQALGLLLPSLSIRTSYGYEESSPSVVVDDTTGELIASDTHTRTDISLTLSQPLFNLPDFLEWQRRKVKEQARKESYRVSDGDAYVATINAYLSLVSSRLQADVARDFESQLSDLLSYIEKRANAGAASISDMARVKARSQATLSSRLELESTHAAAGTEFIRLTNLVPQRVLLPVLEDVGASLLPESFEMAVASAMSSNPEIAVLKAELQSANINQSITKSRYLPRVDVDYTDTYSLHAGGSPDSQRDKRLMLVMNWNLLNGGKDYKELDERRARHQEFRYLLDDQRRRVIQALSADYAVFKTTSARIDSGYLELKSITLAAEAMSKRMLSGNQSLLDLLDVLTQAFQVRSRLVSLHIQEMNTVAQLVRLIRGTPYEDVQNKI